MEMSKQIPSTAPAGRLRELADEYPIAEPSPNLGNLRWWETAELAFPPSKLYRVHYEASGTKFREESDLESHSRAHPHELSDDDFWRAVRLHVNWNTDGTRFRDIWRMLISTYSNKQHAVDWAREYNATHPETEIWIITMDTSPWRKFAGPRALPTLTSSQKPKMCAQ